MDQCSVFKSNLLKFLVFAVLANICCNIVDARTSPKLKVKLSQGGVLVGRHLSSHYGRSIRAFLGIPYVQPPIGKLRFEAPVPFGSWVGERLAVKDSEKCTQLDITRRDVQYSGTEDCLYLNVYTPEEPKSQEPLPVMVWLHGGGWEFGSGLRSFYGPDYLLDRDIILVTANYRLGPLGFLSTETLDCPGNNAFKDQVEVLKWVQQNIAAFGGNASSVTIFGESAGGATVTYLMHSDKSKGLFHKAISQSGSLLNFSGQTLEKGVAATRARKLAELVGCENNSSQWNVILDCLRTKSDVELMSAINGFKKIQYDANLPFRPVVEPDHADAFLTAVPNTKDISHANSLPLMIGATADEGLLRTVFLLNEPKILEDFREKFDKILPVMLFYDHHPTEVQNQITSKIKNFYLKNGLDFDKENHQNLTNLMTDTWFITGIVKYIQRRISHKGTAPTFVYLFDHKGQASFSEIFHGGEKYYGTSHVDDLLYLFPMADELFITSSPTRRDLELREAMIDMWVNFANSSNPTPSKSGLLEWKAANSYPFSYQNIGSRDDLGEEPLLRQGKDFFEQRLGFWKELEAYFIFN